MNVMLRKHFFTLLIALVISIGHSAAQIDVVPVSADQMPGVYEGFYYCLPRTVLRVDVLIEETEQVRGPFADYASRMLGLSNVVKTNSRTFSISRVSLTSYQEADPAQYYFIRMPLKVPLGLNLALNNDATLRSLDMPVVDTDKKKLRVTRIEEVKQLITDLPLPEYIEKVDTIVSRISIDTLTFEKITFPRTYIEKTMEQKAREAADYILKLEDDRMKLLTGFQEIGYPGETIKYMNEQLLQLQAEYLALFKGKSRTRQYLQSYVIVPEPGNEGAPVALFRFSANAGIQDKNSFEGEPVTVAYQGLRSTIAPAGHEKLRQSTKRASNGLYYRIPEKVRISVRRGNETLAENEFLVAQLGMTSTLPTRGVRSVEFHPQTGSVMRLKLE